MAILNAHMMMMTHMNIMMRGISNVRVLKTARRDEAREAQQ